MTRRTDPYLALPVAAVLAGATSLSPISSAVADAIASPASAGADEGATLEEIIVTATKQTQQLQKTAAAITALDGTTLVFSGVPDIRAAQQFVPSVRFQAETSSTEIYIRGVGSTLDLPQIDPPTALNFNGVYIPREATSVPLYDVQQIEVLPGPQGTLYGRSVMGGTVNVNFRRPTRDFETLGLLEVGNDSLFHVSAAQNLPAGDTFAMRLAADYLSHDGYMTSGADSQQDWGARASFLWSPNDRLTAYLWAATADKGGHPANLVPKGVKTIQASPGDPPTVVLDPDHYMNSNPWNDQFPEPWASVLPFGQPQAEDQKYDNNMVSGQLDYRVGDAISLTYIPSYLDMSTSANYWLGAFPGNQDNGYRQQTHELRANGQQGWGRWLAGLYYYDLHSHGIFTFGAFDLASGGFPVSIVDENHLRGAAVFGEATFDLTTSLRVIAGGRYAEDQRTGDGRYYNGGGLPPADFLSPYDYDKRFSNFDYKLGIEYDVGDRVMLYAVTQTGYQPGTFNGYASTPTLSNAVDSADITAYTAGIKSRLLEDRLQVNNEVFYYDYSGLVASAYNTVINSNQTFNAKRNEIYGDQLDLIWLPTDLDRLSLSVGYLHARSTDFTLPDGTASYDGFQMQYAPDWTLSAGYWHDFHVGPGYLRAAASTRYESSFYADYGHTPGGRQDAYTKSDASLTYSSNNGRWSLGAWIRNIENVAVIAATAGGSNIPPLAAGATAFLEAPRTYGLRATLSLR